MRTFTFVAPGSPFATCSPWGPLGSCPPPKSEALNEKFSTFRELTAPLAMSVWLTWPLPMCFDFTLFLLSVIAAYELPPSATKTANVAITFA